MIFVVPLLLAGVAAAIRTPSWPWRLAVWLLASATYAVILLR